MDTSYKFMTDVWNTVSHSGSAQIIGAFLMLVGFLCQKSRRVPNGLISTIYVVLGILLYPLLGDRKTIPVDQANPLMLMALLGGILGFLAFVLHFAAYALFGRLLPAGFMPEEATPSVKPPPPTANRNDNTNENPRP